VHLPLIAPHRPASSTPRSRTAGPVSDALDRDRARRRDGAPNESARIGIIADIGTDYMGSDFPVSLDIVSRYPGQFTFQNSNATLSVPILR